MTYLVNVNQFPLSIHRATLITERGTMNRLPHAS